MTGTIQAPATADRRGGRLLLRLLLAAGLLLPSTVLFVQVWQSTSDKEAVASREREGEPYLAALGQLTKALTQAEVAAIAGQPAPSDALARAVDAVTTVDERSGGDLRTRERWSDLRTKIQALPATGAAPDQVDTAYTTVGDLIVALYAKVETTADLVQDGQADSHFLQASVAVGIPATVLRTAHLVNLATIAASESPAPPASLVELAAATSAAVDPANGVVSDLASAGDATASPTLSGSLLSQVDKFQLAVQSLSSITAPMVTPAAVRQGLPQLRQARDDTAVAAAGLSATILAELDKLLATRIDDLAPQRRVAIGALLLAVLLAVLPVVAGAVRPRRRSTGAPQGQLPPAGPAPAAPDPAWPGGAHAAGPQDVDWRERAGAAR